ncbi:FtsX-like permease family protein [Streptosporangium sp. G11]|uniref:FtsX-like permease family protein n=1 Tax=Streptosporangium sp. G11 TaxID=3436926 RepID=UPI003EC0D97F
MLRLIFADLVANRRIWLGTVVIVAVTSAVTTTVASDIETAVHVGGAVGLALYAISGTVLAFVAVTAFVVLGAVLNLTVALQQRDYALWQLVGVRPAAVRAVVLAQLLVVGFVGAVAGSLAAVPFLDPLFRHSFRQASGFDGVQPRFGPVAAASVVLFVMLVVVLGGWHGARRAGRVPAIESLREPEPRQRRMTRLRWFVTGAALLSVAGVAATVPRTALANLTTPLMMLSVLTAALFAATGPVLFGRLLRLWTGLLPARRSRSWYLARSTTAVRRRSAR